VIDSKYTKNQLKKHSKPTEILPQHETSLWLERKSQDQKQFYAAKETYRTNKKGWL